MTPLELVAAIRAHWIAADRPRQRTRVHDDACWQTHAACAMERLCQAVETLETALRHVEWSAADTRAGDPACPRCGRTPHEGHNAVCLIGQALQPQEPPR